MNSPTCPLKTFITAIFVVVALAATVAAETHAERQLESDRPITVQRLSEGTIASQARIFVNP